MPINTPTIKIDEVKQFGKENVKIILHGNNYNESYNEAIKIAYNELKTLIEPFDDPYIIAGNSTISYEIWRDYKNIDKIFVPVGGGGCIAGIAVSMKYLNPNIKIIGVESEDAAGMTESIKQKKIITLDRVGSFTDACAVHRIGSFTYDICKHLVDHMITVNNEEIYEAIKMGYNDTRVLLEPAGALSIAGVYKYTKLHNITDKNIVAILSGANCDLSKLNIIK